MTDKRGLRIVDLMVVVVLTAAAVGVMIDPYSQASLMNLPQLIATSSASRDPSWWLCPVAVVSAALTLLGLTVGARLTTGGRRVFLEGAAWGGWLFFFLALAPGVHYRFAHSFSPISRADLCGLTHSLTCYFQRLPQGTQTVFIG